MAKLLISTQVYENYGSHDWNGVGECPSYWKAKGGMDYVILNFINTARRSFTESATEAVMAIRSEIERDNHAFREYIVDWQIVKDDYLTEFERDQLNYAGKITHGPKQLAWQN